MSGRSVLTTALSKLRSAAGATARVAGPVGARGGRWALSSAARFTSSDTRPAWMNRLPGNRFALAALVALALVALYGVASFARPAASTPPRPTRTTVTATTVVCPDPSDARVSAVTPPGRAEGTGRVQVAGGPVVLSTRGTSWSSQVKKGTGPWTLGASGPPAAGLSVEQTDEAKGLAGTRCPEPAADQWFTGPGPADAKDIVLTLTNVDERPVTVGVDGVSEDGSIEAAAGHAVAVAPHTTQTVRVGIDPAGLGPIAAGVKLLALHVHAASGRVSASVLVHRGKGSEWLPAVRPATHLVVPGVPSGSGGRRLLVTVPGRDEATVRVDVMTPDGTFAPGGQHTLQAAALAVTPLDLGIGGKPAGIRLVANHPIIAALVADQDDDFAVTGAVDPLGDGIDGGVVADARDTTTLLFSAPEGAAVVRVTQIAARGVVGTPKDVSVPAGRTVSLTMPHSPDGDAYALSVVPRPGSGPVYAARLLKIKKHGITVLPIPPARTSVLLPHVEDVPLP